MREEQLTKNTLRVLIVEDNPGDVGLVRAALEESTTSFEVDNVTSSQSCRRALQTDRYDIILLDYSLPGENGLDLLRSISGKRNVPPIIMLTGQGDELIAKDAIRNGASDYCAKGRIDSTTLSRAILEALEKARLEAEEERQREEADRRAVTDPLTGLYNRNYLADALEKECRRAKRYGSPLSCLLLDLDDFQVLNDKHGHLEGDSVLRQVAIAIGNSVREIDIAARYGGDEFCILAPETGLEGAMQLAERLRFAVAAMEVRAGSRSARITVSIGVFSPATMNQVRPTTLLDRSEAALRKAKLTGKNQVCDYTVPSATTA
ncbi:MAG: diguanylate cyclase [Chloroflexi bacterium]|nr:MAG: diguanylate cyclase [Chloroflexota bacterium]